VQLAVFLRPAAIASSHGREQSASPELRKVLNLSQGRPMLRCTMELGCS
jgi:hypothetical protein